EIIRKEIEGRITIREKASTAIDLPLSNACKRILAYAAEEAERLNHRHIGPEHLLLGILREEKCVAAEVLQQFGLRLNVIREELARFPMPPDTPMPPVIPDDAKTGSQSDESSNDLPNEMRTIQIRIEEIMNKMINSFPPEERTELIKEAAAQREK